MVKAWQFQKIRSGVTHDYWLSALVRPFRDLKHQFIPACGYQAHAAIAIRFNNCRLALVSGIFAPRE